MLLVFGIAMHSQNRSTPYQGLYLAVATIARARRQVGELLPTGDHPAVA